MVSFYSLEGLKAVAQYLDDLINSKSISQSDLAGYSELSPATISNIRKNRLNQTEIIRYIEPDIFLQLAPYVPDPRSLVYRPDGVVDYDRSPKFANPEDLLLMARGVIPLKKIEGQIDSDLSLWLKDQMIERGLSVAGLAELMELPEQRVHELFNGQSPTASEVVRIARTLANSDAVFVFKLAGTDINAPLRTCKGGC